MSLADSRARLSDIYKSIQSFGILSQLPIIDSSNEKDNRENREALPGLRYLREEVKRDCDLLDKCLQEHGNQHSASISSNAPYLIAVWDELVHAHQPVAIYRMFSLQCVDGEGKNKAERRQSMPRVKKASKNPNLEVKVDVVADNGARWVRVNTMKNSRLMMEFREIDSYLTSSDEDEDELRPRPGLAQIEFDNSLLRMGRQILAVAKANPIWVPGLLPMDCGPSVATITPNVTLRLTRLDPVSNNSADPRIEKTIQCLRDMGIDVQLGERLQTHMAPIPKPLAQPKLLEPTTNINLDLSALIALISDITHSPLPRTEQEAHARFEPSQSYLEWRKDQAKSPARQNQMSNPAEDDEDEVATWENSGQHSRALAAQAIQEMEKSILEEIHERILAISSDHLTPQIGATFWTTREARHRCLQIVSKIGGERERQRADALLGSNICSRTPPIPAPGHISSFSNGNTPDGAPSSTTGVLEVDAYWTSSRYSTGFLPLPVRVYPPTLSETREDEDQQARSTFFSALVRTCTGILSHGTASSSQVSAPFDSMSSAEDVLEEIPPATLTSLPKLTVHTVVSMLSGASRGHTTLTTNRSSVKAVLTEMRRVCGRGGYEAAPGTVDVEKAALWILAPRSLSEGMRSE